MGATERADAVATITALLHRYARGVAEADPDMVSSVFSDKAKLDYGSGPKWVKVSEYFRRELGEPQRIAHGAGLQEYAFSTPMIGNIDVDVDGDSATARSFWLVIHGGIRNGEKILLLRGTENRDLLHYDDGWRIHERAHRAIWSVTMPAEFAVRTKA